MQSLAKISSAFLLVLLTLSGPVVPEILKLPKLISHFHKHNKVESVRLVDFLINHYAHEHGTDSDAAEDRELPFLSGNMISLVPCSTPPTQVILPALFPNAISDFKAPGNHLLPNPHLSMIWQPPRFS